MIPLAIGVSGFLTQALNGLVLGMTLVLVALGLTVIFGMMDIVNFAHGDFLLVGAYVGWTVTDVTGSFVAALLVAPLVGAVLGTVIERFLLRRTYDRNPLLQLLLTFGLAEVLRESVQIIWGRTGKFIVQPEWASGAVDLYVITYPMYRLFVILATAIIVVALFVFLERTRLGIAIRAGTYDKEMVSSLGINVKRVYTIIFALGVAIAALAGTIIAPIRTVYPTLGIDLLIPAFVVVILAGLDSFRGTVIAGIVVGEAMVLTGIINGAVSNVSIMVIMAIVLLVRSTDFYRNQVSIA